MATQWLAGMMITPERLNETTFQMVQTGTEQVQFAASTFHSRTVTFPTPFPSTPNIVIPVINSASSETDRWIVRVFSVTTTEFGLSLVEATNTARAWTSNRMVNWIAILV